MAKILATYSHRVDDKTIRDCDVEVFDVDDLGIWLRTEPEPGAICTIHVPWREIVELMPKKVEALLAVMNSEQEEEG